MAVIKECDNGLVVRHAEAKDKSPIGEIDAFGDLDYLEQAYDHFMENPDKYTCFLAELKGRVIAFCYIYLIDDGETLIWGGKRTHEEFRGQGHFGVFIDTLENYARRQHPAVKSWAYTALWINYQKTYIASLEQAGALRKVVTRNFLVMDISMENLQSLKAQKKTQEMCREYDIRSIVKADENVPPAFLDPRTQAHLFPQDSVIVFWEPYRPLHSNFDYIMHTSQCNITYSSKDDTTEVKAVNFMTERNCVKTTLVRDAEIYVSDAQSLEDQAKYLHQHIIKAVLGEIQKDGEFTKLAVMLHFPKLFSVAKLKERLTEHLHGVSFHEGYEEQYLACHYDPNVVKKSSAN